jgi:hypothetical protein
MLRHSAPMALPDAGADTLARTRVPLAISAMAKREAPDHSSQTAPPGKSRITEGNQSYGKIWRSHGDSNPGFRRERGITHQF